jgi:hypothetical protein
VAQRKGFDKHQSALSRAGKSKLGHMMPSEQRINKPIQT